jgi:hypothetical protein
MSIVFALLPHAPRLEDLTAATPLLLRWASLVAHVAPDNVDAVPKAVRSEGVERLMSLLRETVAATEAEREKTEREEAEFERGVESALIEGETKGIAKGIAMGETLPRASPWAKPRALPRASPWAKPRACQGHCQGHCPVDARNRR